MTPITQSEINNAAWAACDTFRGVVDPSIYKDYVLTMLFLKYISDVWKDHQARYEAEHPDSPELVEAMMLQESFVLPADASFDTLHKRRHEAGNGERIDKALHAIQEANGNKLDQVFQDIHFNSTKLGDEEQKNDLLRHLLEDFAKTALDLRPSRIGQLDIIGGAYEYLIKHFAATAGKTAGEFYTPPEVSDLIARLADPQEGDDICDPTCGSASLLMKCGRQIRNKTGTKRYALYGQESIGSTWALAKMNLFLHGEENHEVVWGDTIRNPKLRVKEDALRHFDVVVANPPFSLDKWGTATAEADTFGRFRRGIPPKTKGDYAFILHMIETLKPKTGRAVVVVPPRCLVPWFVGGENPSEADRGEPAGCGDRPAREIVLWDGHPCRTARVPQTEIRRLCAVHRRQPRVCVEFQPERIGPSPHRQDHAVLCGSRICGKIRLPGHQGRDRRERLQPQHPSLCRYVRGRG